MRAQNMRILCLLVVSLIFSIAQKQSYAEIIPSIDDFHDSKMQIRLVPHVFIEEKNEEKAYWIATTLYSSPISAMAVFENDLCVDEFTHLDGSGSFKFKCKSGATISASFNCRNDRCVIRGKHSERGSVVLKLKAPDNISLGALRSFYNGTEKPTKSVETEVVKPVVATIKKVEKPPISKPAVQPTQTTTTSVGVLSSDEQTTIATSASHTKWRNAQSPEQAQAFANDIQATILMYMAIAEVIEQQPPNLKNRLLNVVNAEIKRLRAEKEFLQQQLSQRFSTPIRPSNANLTVSAFRAADTFPKIPFYVPGTNEIGEMLVIPRVTDGGYLEYQFDFLDPVATYDKVRDSLSIPHENVNDIIAGLQKIDEWTRIAQENNVNRRIEKTSACVPVDACETKQQGVSSSEIIFQVYEDGSTAGRIQRNKGMFSVGYNMSVESSILLSAYLTYMRDVGAKEFKVGIMSDEEVIKLFN